MTRAVPLWRRWAIVSRDGRGAARIERTFSTLRGARRVHAALTRSQPRTWNHQRVVLELEPTDHGPRVERLARLLELLGARPYTVTDLSAATAMSPRGVERMLLELGRRGMVAYRQQVVQDGRCVHAGWWCLTVAYGGPVDWATELHELESHPHCVDYLRGSG